MPRLKFVPVMWYKIKGGQVKVAEKIGSWIDDYNTKASLSALGMLTPVQFCDNWKLKSGL